MSAEDQLFQLPSGSPILSPVGQATDALLKYLKANSDNWHCFTNKARYHNHVPHHLYAVYRLGADAQVLDTIYQQSVKPKASVTDFTVSPVPNPPHPITRNNWKESLGKQRFYAAYLEFFSKELLEKGLSAVLEEYVFNPDVNLPSLSSPTSPSIEVITQPDLLRPAHLHHHRTSSSNTHTSPQMFSRAISGVFHPLIQLGHGTESGIVGLSAEALAEIAVHLPSSTPLLPAKFFTFPSESDDMSGMSGSVTEKPVVHAFDILQRILDDPGLEPLMQNMGSKREYVETVKAYGPLIYAHAAEWNVGVKDEQAEIHEMVEQICFVTAWVYGVGGWKDERYVSDLYIVHALNAAIFLPSILEHLRPTSQRLLLRAFLSATLAHWISRGRSPLDIKQFMARTDSGGTFKPGGHKNALKLENMPKVAECLATQEDDLDHLNLDSLPSPTLQPDDWPCLLTAVLTHSDVHLIKLQRALAEFGKKYGSRPKGFFSRTTLNGAEELDGSIFWRVAKVNMDHFGWVGERRGHLPLWAE